jgi:protein SCO1/2
VNILVKLLAISALAIISSSAVAFNWINEPDKAHLPAIDKDHGGDFTLDSVSGPVSLSNYKGKVVMVYFGYASCPDVCPTTMLTISQGMKLLNESESDQVAGIFISVDPKRDKVGALDKYAKHFHPNMVGVTGDPKELRKIANQYTAEYYFEELPDSAMGYVVNHTSYIYLVDKQGRLRNAIDHDFFPDILAEQIRLLINE